MVKNNKNIKSGFSLAEALISMLLIAVFFVATSKVITTKPKSEPPSTAHGYFECYIEGGRLMQKISNGVYAEDAAPATGGACRLTPPSNMAYSVIYYLNGDGFCVSTEAQFSGNSAADGSINIHANQLRVFTRLMSDPSDINTNKNELRNYLEDSYPSSAIYGILRNNINYRGPAVIIGW